MEVLKGNRREIPGDLPPWVWVERVREARGNVALALLPWYHPTLEYLSPTDLQLTRAKAFVWYEMTGEYPTDINSWWEVRQARKVGYVPPRTETAAAHIDDNNVLHCGECNARYSADHGMNHSVRVCNLCGINLV